MDEIQTINDLPADKCTKIYLIEQYVAMQHSIIMVECCDEVSKKLAGLFKARKTVIRRILNGEL